jgi:hypothetical protein
MKAPLVHQLPLGQIDILRADSPFGAGDLLRGSFVVDDVEQNEVRSAELSVMWYTVGKGEEDLGVHYFQRFATDGPDAVDLSRRREFRTLLPPAPLSYDGVIVKVCWCARLRIFLGRGRQHVVEAPFQLGIVERPTAWQIHESLPGEGPIH